MKFSIFYVDPCCSQYNNNRQTNHIGSSRTISKLIIDRSSYLRCQVPRILGSRQEQNNVGVKHNCEDCVLSSMLERRCNHLKRCCSGRCLVRRFDWARGPRNRKQVLAVNVPPPLLLLWALFGQLDLYHNETPAVCLHRCYSTCHWHKASMSLFFVRFYYTSRQCSLSLSISPQNTIISGCLQMTPTCSQSILHSLSFLPIYILKPHPSHPSTTAK